MLRALAKCLIELLDSERAGVREGALRTLGLLKADTYREQVEACVRDAHPGTRGLGDGNGLRGVDRRG